MNILLLVALLPVIPAAGLSAEQHQEIYQISIYQVRGKEQEDRMDKYLQYALIPALNRSGISHVGVFKPLANDTSAVRKIYVFVPFSSLEKWQKMPGQLEKDKQYSQDGKDYLDAPYNNPPYQRIESVLLKAFSGMPQYGVPDLKNPASERIYELRSYEGPTEKLYQNKVRMFIAGDEVGLFKRLNFNAVFYAEVLSGSHMPNLMYMTSFENMDSHDQHWKNFTNDPVWKNLSGMPEYQNNVSHIDIVLMHPASYSQL